MKEIISLRKAKEKHFLCEDGTFKAFCYKDDIHYLDNGEYKEIDNTLIKQEDYYINKSNDFNVMFTSCVDKNLLYKILLKDKFLEVLLEEKKQDNNKIEVKNNEITYVNLLENVDFKYEIIGKKLKETIILNQNNYSQIRFILRTNLNLKLNNNVVYAYDNDTLIYKFESPFVYNDEKNLDINLEYELKSYNDCYELILKFDKEKLNNVLFPIYIDPTINTDTEGEVYDTYIYPNDESVDRNNQDYLKIGVDSNNVIYRSLLKFDLPTIGPASQVVNATLYLTSHPTDWRYPLQDLIHEKIGVHEITNSWTEETANWNNLNDKYNSILENYAEFSRTEQTVEDGKIKYNLYINDINITNLVKKWYSGTENNGLMLKFINENYNSDCKEYYMYSKNNDASSSLGKNPKPYLEITYRNQNGLSKGNDYNVISHSFGKTYINNYNGNVINYFKFFNFEFGNVNYDIGIYHNSNDALLNNYEKGWKYSFFETLCLNNNVLEYTSSSSNIIYFKSTEQNKFIDEYNLKIDVIYQEDKYIMSTKDGIKKTFTKINNENLYYLTEITNENNNKIIINYNNVKKISTIKNDKNDIITFEYNSNNDSIILYKNNTQEEKIVFANNLITQIITDMGTINFEYNNNDTISKIIDVSGTFITMEYFDKSYKIKTLKEYGNLGTSGKVWNFKYDFNSTSIVDNSNKKYTYIFNKYGNTIGTLIKQNSESIKDIYGFNKNYVDNISSTVKNNATSETRMLKYTNNLWKNSSFEDSLDQLVTGGSRVKENSRTGEYSYKSSNKINVEILSLNGNTIYTFSGYIQNNKPVTIRVYSNTLSKTEILNEFVIPINEEYTKFSISFPFTGATGHNEVELEIDNNGIMYIDDLQLEEGNVSNEYNMIENSNFTYNFDGWELSGVNEEIGEKISDYYVLKRINQNEIYLDMKSRPDTTISISKHFNIKGKAGDIYNLSFLYKNKGVLSISEDFGNVEIDGSGRIGNFATISFFNVDEEMGTGTDTIELNKHNDEWQFFSQCFMAETDYNGFDLSIISANEVNDLLLTNFMLVKNIGSYTIEYDDNGNIKTFKDYSNNSYNFKYGNNNNLIQIMESQGGNFVYEYDNNNSNKLLNAISASGISNEIKYDSNGNPITTIINVLNENNELVENKMYNIKLKGTDKYLNYLPTEGFTIKESSCNQKEFMLLKNENNYYIKCNNKFIFIENDDIKLDLNKKSSFEFLKKDNCSYSIKIDNKALTILNNNLVLKDYDSSNYNQEFYFVNSSESKKIVNSAKYTNNKKYVNEVKDSLGNITKFDIDETTGNVRSITNAKNYKISLNYNNIGDLSKLYDNKREVNFIYGENNNLSKIISKNRTYNFVYDEFNNMNLIKINNNVLLKMTYDNSNNLINENFGNKYNVNYVYDVFDRISKKIKDDCTFNYFYDNFGNLVEVKNDFISTKFLYDYANRICGKVFKDINENLFSTKYIYNNSSAIINKKYFLNYNQFIKTLANINMEYDKNNNISKIINNLDTFKYNYDEIGRLSSLILNNNELFKIEYVSNGNNTSTLIKSIKYDKLLYEYLYDKVSNIIDIKLNNKLYKHFEYDEINQLISENNYIDSITWRYYYDLNNNIIRKDKCKINSYDIIETIKYEYSSVNPDVITKYNDDLIESDAYGNPVKIGNKVLEWKNGKELCSITDNGNNINYTYNCDGLRVSKIVNNIERYHYYDNNKIVAEKINNNIIHYLRDTKGNLIGFTYNDEKYYYIKNIQEDITGILDKDLNLIAKYFYDSWGKVEKICDANGNLIVDNTNIAIINPFRYKGYYYDNESGLYYTNNRYYNPNWGRFISIDTNIGKKKDFTSYNLYVAFANNPINNNDEYGKFWKKIGGWVKSASTWALKALKTVCEFTSITFKESNNLTPPTEVSGSYLGYTIKSGTSSTVSTKNSDSDKPYGVEFEHKPGELTKSFNNLITSSHVTIGKEGVEMGAGFYSRDRKELTTLSYGISFTNLSFYAKINSNIENNVYEEDGLITTISSDTYGEGHIGAELFATLYLIYAVPATFDAILLSGLKNAFKQLVPVLIPA